MNFKKIGRKFHNVRRIGNKVAHGVAMGLKKGGNLAVTGSKVIEVIGMATAQPEIVAGAEALKGVGKTAKLGGSALEKTRRGNLLGAVRKGKKAQSQIKGMM